MRTASSSARGRAAWAAASPAVLRPAAQTELDPSRNEASAPKKANVVPRTGTRYGVKAARRFAPMPTTWTGLCRIARRVSCSPSGP